MANKYENAENIGKLLSGGALSELGKKVGASERRMSEILKKLSDMESAIQAAKKQEEERRAAEADRERKRPESSARPQRCRRGGQAANLLPPVKAEVLAKRLPRQRRLRPQS